MKAKVKKSVKKIFKSVGKKPYGNLRLAKKAAQKSVKKSK